MVGASETLARESYGTLAVRGVGIRSFCVGVYMDNASFSASVAAELRGVEPPAMDGPSDVEAVALPPVPPAPPRLHTVFGDVCAALAEALTRAEDWEGAAVAQSIQSWHDDGNIHAAWTQAIALLERVLGGPLR